jgi:hypothetical protein
VIVVARAVHLHIYESIHNSTDPLTRRPADNRPTAVGRVLSSVMQNLYHEGNLWRPMERALSRIWNEADGKEPGDRGVLVILETWYRPQDWGQRLVRFSAAMSPSWGTSWNDAANRRYRADLQRGRGGWRDDGNKCVVHPPDMLRAMPEPGWFRTELDIFVSPDGPGPAPGITHRVRTFAASVEPARAVAR